MPHNWEDISHKAWRCESCGIAVLNTGDTESHEIKYIRYIHSDDGYGFFVTCDKKTPDRVRFDVQNCDLMKAFLVHIN